MAFLIGFGVTISACVYLLYFSLQNKVVYLNDSEMKYYVGKKLNFSLKWEDLNEVTAQNEMYFGEFKGTPCVKIQCKGKNPKILTLHSVEFGDSNKLNNFFQQLLKKSKTYNFKINDGLNWIRE